MSNAPQRKPNAANTIMAHLGGNRFIAMTGARNLIGGDNILGMKLPANLTKGRATHCRIKIEENDTYTIETLKMRKLTDAAQNMIVVQSADQIYVDQLQTTFTRLTGLDTHL